MKTPCGCEGSGCLSAPHSCRCGDSAGLRHQLRSRWQQHRVPAAAARAVPAHRHAPPQSKAPAGTVLPARRALPLRSSHVGARTHPVASKKSPRSKPGGSRSGGARHSLRLPSLVTARRCSPRKAKFGCPRRRSRLPSKLTEHGHRLNFQQRSSSAPTTASPISSRCGARALLPSSCGAGEYKSTLPLPAAPPQPAPAPPPR